MKREHWVIFAVLTALATSCVGGEMPRKLVVVALDTSATTSPEDWALYRSAVAQVIDRKGDLRPGDRLVVTTISGTTLTQFVPVADVALPDTGVALNDADDADLRRTEVEAAIDKLQTDLFQSPEGKAQQTLILDMAQLAGQVFRNDPARSSRHLLLFSDMLEESADANFRLRPPGEKSTAEIIARLRDAGRLPDLTGVRVQVLGARSASSTSMAAIETFWHTFFDATGAELRPGDYSRAGVIVRLLR